MEKTLDKIVKVIVMLTVAVLIGSGLMWVVDYQQTKLENGAYKYLERELYGSYSDVVVWDVKSVGDGRYDIEYYYNKDGDTIHGWNYDVAL